MRLYYEPEKHAYHQLIDFVMDRTDYFIVKVMEPNSVDDNPSLYQILTSLEPFLHSKQTLSTMKQILSLHQNNHIYYTMGTYYQYRCCDEAASIIKEYTSALSDWRLPSMPEDLCFVDHEGQELLYSVVHESIYGMNMSEAEANVLMRQIRGVCFKRQEHAELDLLLQDIEYHQIPYLYLSGYHLTELPKAIANLTHLRTLEIFEQDIQCLSEPLFSLQQLESFKLMCADLDGIPPEIGLLSKLEHLSITCGSSDRTSSSFKVKPKEQISLKAIPAELAQLKRLKTLALNYTAISHLPIEIQQLHNLEMLELIMCMIEKEPAFLTKMNKLKSISITTEHPYKMINIFE